MRLKSSFLAVLCSVIIASCTTEVYIDPVLEISSSEAELVGYIRAEMDYVDSNYSPYISVPYNNTTGSEISIEVKNSVDIVPALSVGSYDLVIPKGTGCLQIPVYGYVGSAQENVSVGCSIVTPEGYCWYINTTTNVYAADFELPNLDFTFEIDAKVMRDTYIQSTNGTRYIALTYTNGWSRTVTFSVTNDDCELILNNGEEILLPNDGEQHTLYLDVYGKYLGSDENIDFEIKAECNDNSVSSVTLNIPTYEPEPLSITSVEFDDSKLEKNKSIGTDSLEIYYTNGEGRDITITTSCVEEEFGLSFTEQKYTLDDSEGYFKVGFTKDQRPLADGELNLNIEINGDAITETISKTKTIVINPETSKLTIHSVKLTGAIINDGDEDDFKVIVEYSNGTSGQYLSLKGLYCAFVCDSEQLAALSSIEVSEEDNSIATFNLGNQFFTSTYSQYTTSSATGVPISSSASMTLEYNDESYAVSTDKLEYTGFVWNGNHYDLIYIGSGAQIWLDRNLGASRVDNLESPWFIYDSSVSCYVISNTWQDDYRALGDYFQRGRSTGLPVLCDENNPYVANGLQPYMSPYFSTASGTWENGCWVSALTDGVGTANCTDADNITLLNSLWNSTSSGGSANPCPSGYRVPTKEEVELMLINVCGSNYSSTSNTNINKLVDDMNFTFSGYLAETGTAKDALAFVDGVITNSHFSRGSQGAVGLITAGNTASNNSTYSYSDFWAGKWGFTAGDLSIPPYKGVINIMTCDYSMDYTTSATNYVVVAMATAATGTIEFSSHNYIRSMPVRCIFHQ